MKLLLFFLWNWVGYSFLWNQHMNCNTKNRIPMSIPMSENVKHTYNIDSLLNKKNKTYHHFHIKPRLNEINDKGQLTWYPIGFSKDFDENKKQITIRDKNYIVWKGKNQYYGMRDCCSHQGSSFMNGNIIGKDKNMITCPYHGYIFDGSNGKLVKIPKLTHIDSDEFNVNNYKVIEKGGFIYLNTIPMKTLTEKEKIDENEVFVEPEFHNKNHKAIFLEKEFEHYAKIVTVNSLDISHIGFVHAFGNRQNPNPMNTIFIKQEEDVSNHYKATYHYISGKKSLINKVYRFTNIHVENEYVLPHSTVARVHFGNLSSTIITHALPISKFKTKLFVKAYRNYLYYDLEPYKHHFLYPFLFLLNFLADKMTLHTMIETLQQDKEIVDNIDKYDYQSMHGSFSITNDLLSSHYKNNYVQYYETNENTL